MFLSQLLRLEPPLVDNIAAPLLTQILPQRTISSSPPVLDFFHWIGGLVIRVPRLSFLQVLLVSDSIQFSDEGRVQRDHVGLELVEQAVDFGFLALVRVFVGVCLEGVVVRFSGSRDEEGCEALVVCDAENVFIGTPAHVLNALAVAAPGHVGALHFTLVCLCGVEEASPDADLGAPADGCEATIADCDGGAGLVAGVGVDFAEHADVPDVHFLVLAC